MALGDTLEECADEYRNFCRKYKPKPKPEKKYYWGKDFLPKVIKGKKKRKVSPGQMRLPWDDWEVDQSEITQVAEKFVFANCYNRQAAAQGFQN